MNTSIKKCVTDLVVIVLLAFGSSGYASTLLEDVEVAVVKQDLEAVERLHDELTLSYAVLAERFTLALSEAEKVPLAAQGLDLLFHEMSVEAEELFGQGDPSVIQVQSGNVQFVQELIGPRHWLAATALQSFSVYLMDFGQLERAAMLLDEAYEIAVEQLGAGHPSSIEILVDGYLIPLRSGDFAAALDILSSGVSQYSDLLGVGHAKSIAVGLLQVDVLIAVNELSRARQLQAQICQNLGQSRGIWHPSTLSCRHDEASLLARLGRQDEAELAFHEILKLSTQGLGATSTNSLEALLELAELERGRGDFLTARNRLDLVLQLSEPNSSYRLMAKDYLARVLRDEGLYPEAIEVINDLLPAAEAYWQKKSVNYYTILMEKGRLQQRSGLLGEAELTFQFTLRELLGELGEEHPLTIVAGSNLGQLYEQMGLYDEAEPLLKKALEQFVGVQGETSVAASRARNNLALLYESQGNFRDAEPLYEQSYDLLIQQFGADYNEAVAIQNNLAFLYMMMQDFAQAEAGFLSVVDSWAQSLGIDHPRRLKALNNLGRVQLGQNRLAEAEQTLLMAVTLRKSKLGDRHPDVIRSMIDLGRLYSAQLRLAEADVLTTTALQLSEAVLGEQHPYTFDALNSLASIKKKNNQLDAAIELSQKGFLRRSVFLDRMLWVTGENAREGYIRLHRQEFDDYLSLLVQVGGEENARRVLEASLHRKGLLLKITSQIQQVSRMSKNPELADVAVKLRRSRESLALLTLSGPTTDTVGQHVQMLYELELEVNELQGAMGRASAQYRSSIAPLDVDKLQLAVTADKALVDFLAYRSDDRPAYLASVLVNKAGRYRHHLIDFPEAAKIDRGIVEYRDVIQDLSVEDEELFEYGQDIYTAIWSPIDAVLEGLDYVYLVPDGLLNILPFAALVTIEEEYLVQAVDLHILTSGRDLLPNYIAVADGSYLLFAGPDYDISEVVPNGQINDPEIRTESTSLALRGAAGGLRGLKFVPLPGAEKEGEIIVTKAASYNIALDSFTQARAQERVISELEQVPSVLHIASHGFFLKANETLTKRLLKQQRGSAQVPPPGDNPLLRAGLAFAGINANAQYLGRINTQNDGILTALEVLDLNLSGTKLVVLSACETGLGEIHEGEGIYGLRRAFQEAGVGEIVSSLWEVSDSGTQALMTGFNDKVLAGVPPRDALRMVQLELIESVEWGYPYVWASFMMVGSS